MHETDSHRLLKLIVLPARNEGGSSLTIPGKSKSSIARFATQCSSSGTISRNGSEDAPSRFHWSTRTTRTLTCREVCAWRLQVPGRKAAKKIGLAVSRQGPSPETIPGGGLPNSAYYRGTTYRMLPRMLITMATSNCIFIITAWRVLGLDNKFRAAKNALQRSKKYNPAWGAGCNQALQDVLQAEFRVAAAPHYAIRAWAD